METPVVIGVDPSSKHIAMVAHVEGQRPFVRKFELGDSKYEPQKCSLALSMVSHYLIQLRRAYGVSGGEIAYVEWPVVAGARNIRSTIVQSFINGAIQACFLDNGVGVFHVTPAEWKLALGGKGRGNADKEVVAGLLGQRWPEAWSATCGDGDCIDAAAIALYGHSIQSRGRRLMDGLGELPGDDASVLQSPRSRPRVQRRVRNGTVGRRSPRTGSKG